MVGKLSQYALLILFLASCKDDDIVASAPPELTTVDPEPVPLEQPWLGVFVSNDAQDLLAPYGSVVLTFPLQVGQSVEKGQHIATLDARPIMEELTTARAALAAANAKLRATRVSLESSEDKLVRKKRGVEGGFAAADEVATAEFDVKRLMAEVAQSKAAVAEQAAQVQALEKRLVETKIVAPFAGEVVRKYVEVGSKIDKDAPLARVSTSSGLTLRFALPPDKRNTVKRGTALQLSCDVGGTRVVASAETTYISPEIDPVAEMLVAEAALSEHPVRPGEPFTAGVVCTVQTAPPSP